MSAVALKPGSLKLVPTEDEGRRASDPRASEPRMATPRARRAPPTQRRIERRRWRVTIAKRVLPVVALALLATVALWPELNRDATRARMALRGLGNPESGQLTEARYNGVDEHNHPYTVTADAARQATPERIDLTRPVGDITLQTGTWMRVGGQQGVYMQQSGQLDLSGNVTLYRDDGTTMLTDAATVDVKSGAASSAEKTHVEGPFGTLDAQGFTLLDRGAVVQFQGPGRMVLNGHGK